MTTLARPFIAAVWLLAFAGPAALAQSSTYTTGLTGPVKLDLTHHGNLIVTERGTAANDGRLTLIDRNGVARPILSGLPSGIEVTGVPSGPQAPVLTGCCLMELTIGEGDMLRFSPAGPPSQVPNTTGSVSPIFSSVLRIVFSEPVDYLDEGFTLTRADHDSLADGHTVKLQNAAGEKAWIRLVVDFKDARPDALTNVRGSNPFAMISSRHGAGLLVVDSGQNSLLDVGWFGWPEVIARFPRVRNPAGVFPPFSDSVPTAVRHFGGSKYLVSLLVGVPFAPGTASIQLVDAKTGAVTPFITGLTSVTDVLKVGTDIYVLEISTNLLAGAPGRLLKFSSPTAAPQVVVPVLIGGSGMVYDPHRRAIFIAEIFAGRITRVDL